MKRLILMTAGLFFPKVFGVFFKNRTSMKYSVSMMLTSYITEIILNHILKRKPVLAVARPKQVVHYKR